MKITFGNTVHKETMQHADFASRTDPDGTVWIKDRTHQAIVNNFDEHHTMESHALLNDIMAIVEPLYQLVKSRLTELEKRNRDTL